MGSTFIFVCFGLLLNVSCYSQPKEQFIFEQKQLVSGEAGLLRILLYDKKLEEKIQPNLEIIGERVFMYSAPDRMLIQNVLVLVKMDGIEVELSSKWAEIDNKTSDLEMWDDVRMVKMPDLRVYTERMFWNNKLEQLTSSPEIPVKIFKFDAEAPAGKDESVIRVDGKNMFFDKKMEIIELDGGQTRTALDVLLKTTGKKVR